MRFQSRIVFPFDEAGTALLASPIVLATLRFQISDLQDCFFGVLAGIFSQTTSLFHLMRRIY